MKKILFLNLILLTYCSEASSKFTAHLIVAAGICVFIYGIWKGIQQYRQTTRIPENPVERVVFNIKEHILEEDNVFFYVENYVIGCDDFFHCIINLKDRTVLDQDLSGHEYNTIKDKWESLKKDEISSEKLSKEMSSFESLKTTLIGNTNGYEIWMDKIRRYCMDNNLVEALGEIIFKDERE